MDISAIIVVVIGMLLFFGFIIWMAIFSRRENGGNDREQAK